MRTTATTAAEPSTTATHGAGKRDRVTNSIEGQYPKLLDAAQKIPWSTKPQN